MKNPHLFLFASIAVLLVATPGLYDMWQGIRNSSSSFILTETGTFGSEKIRVTWELLPLPGTVNSPASNGAKSSVLVKATVVNTGPNSVRLHSLSCIGMHENFSVFTFTVEQPENQHVLSPGAKIDFSSAFTVGTGIVSQSFISKIDTYLNVSRVY